MNKLKNFTDEKNFNFDFRNFELDQNIIDSFKNNELFVDLNLTDQEVKRFAAVLEKIKIQNEICLQNPKDCYLKQKKHHILLRNELNGSLYYACVNCQNYLLNEKKEIYKTNMLYNSFKNSKLEKIKLNDIFLKNCTDDTKKIIFLFKEIFNSDQTKGCYLWGNFLTGKTHLFSALANLVIKKFNKTVCFLNFSDLILKIKSTFNIPENSIEKRKIVDLIDKLKKCDVLFFDDFGSECAHDWFLENFLYQILDFRIINEKLTFFNSNYNLEQLLNLFNSKNVSNSKKIISKISRLINNVFEIKNQYGS